MVRRFLVAAIVSLGWLGGVGLPSPRGFAADEATPPQETSPFAVISVAGVDRWQENVRYLFQTIDRGEISDAAEGMLGRVNDLKGMDRTRPLGLMVFLDGLTPSVVGFLPASNLDDLAVTMSIGPVTAKKVEGDETRWELVGGRTTLHVRFQNEYALIADRTELLDRKFPDPASLVRTLNQRYDLAASLDLDRIPEATRKILLGFLQASVQAQLQQRDNESKTDYRIRRASGTSNLELMEQILAHGRKFNIGWDVAPDQKRAVLEMSLEVRPDSEFAQGLAKVGSKPTRFRGLLRDGAPLSFAVSWQMNKARKDSFVEVVKAVREAVAPTELAEGEKPRIENEALRNAAGKLFDQFVETSNTGHLDFIAQLNEGPSGKFVLTGGLGLVDGSSVSGSLAELVTGMSDSPPFSETHSNVETHRGVAIHQLVPRSMRSQDKAVYGEDASIWLGTGANAFWFAFGGDDAVPALRTMLDNAAESGQPANGDAAADPFRMVVNMNRWKNVGAGDGTRPQPGRELMQKAFAPGNDGLRIDFRPTENGARLRLEFDEGFLRMLGLAISRRFDRAQL